MPQTRERTVADAALVVANTKVTDAEGERDAANTRADVADAALVVANTKVTVAEAALVVANMKVTDAEGERDAAIELAELRTKLTIIDPDLAVGYDTATSAIYKLDAHEVMNVGDTKFTCGEIPCVVVVTVSVEEVNEARRDYNYLHVSRRRGDGGKF